MTGVRLGTAVGQALGLHLLCGFLALAAMLAGSASIGASIALASYNCLAAIALALRHLRRPDIGPRLVGLLAVEALVITGIAVAAAVVPARALGPLLVLSFAWAGIHIPSWRRHLLIAPGIVVYVAAAVYIANRGGAAFEPLAVVFVFAVCGLVAEIVAMHVRRSARSAEAFRVVSQVAGDLMNASSEEVFTRVVRAVIELGYDGANITQVDEREGVFRVEHAAGIAASFTGTYALGRGLSGRVHRLGTPQVFDDYASLDDGFEIVRAAGVRTCVGVPIVTRGEFAGALIAWSASRREIRQEDVDALTLLGRGTGIALEASTRFEAVVASNEQLRDASETDPLTGVPNRRAADDFLAALRFGDAVAILDLDHFKRVNDDHGHLEGDATLVTVATYLRHELRVCDLLARYGGEEFVIVMPATSAEEAGAALERVREGWNATRPVTTFSAGVAAYTGSSERTLALADDALYAAKAAGRDRVAVAPSSAGSRTLAS